MNIVGSPEPGSPRAGWAHGPAVPAKQVHWVTPVTVGWALVVLLSLIAGISLTQVHPGIPLGIIVGLLGLLLLVRYPFLGVLAYIVFEYARLPAMFPVLQPLNLGKLIVAATAVAWVAKMIVTREFHFVRDKVNLLMGVWIVLALASCTDAVQASMAFQGTVGLAKFVASYYLIVSLATSLSKWKWCAWVLIFLHLKMSQFQLRSYAQGILTADDRYQFIRGGVGAGGDGGFFGNSTDFGAAMCVIAPVALYAFRTTKSRLLRLSAFIAAVAFPVSILRSGSRGAAVALLAMSCVLWLKSSRRLLVGTLVALSAFGFWFAAPAEWQQRFKSGADYDRDLTASSRLRFWKAGFEMLTNHPINGVGVDNFTESYRAMGGEGYVAHSIWIEGASELGVLGILTIGGVMVLGFRRNAQTRDLCRGDDEECRFIRGMSDALDLSLVGYMVAGTFTSILYYPFLFMTMALIISLHHIALNRLRPI
jgi:putative inorganic carbon (hco3(-)) transporter